MLESPESLDATTQPATADVTDGKIQGLGNQQAAWPFRSCAPTTIPLVAFNSGNRSRASQEVGENPSNRSAEQLRKIRVEDIVYSPSAKISGNRG